MLLSTHQYHTCFALFQSDVINPEAIFVGGLDHLVVQSMWGMTGGVMRVSLSREAVRSQQFARWLHKLVWRHFINVPLCKWRVCNGGMVSDYFLLRPCLSSTSISRKAQMIKSLAPCPYYLSQISHKGTVWVLPWPWRVKMWPKRICLLLCVMRRTSGFSFVLNSDCAASNSALSTVMSFLVVKLRAPCKGSTVIALSWRWRHWGPRRENVFAGGL